MSCDPNFSCDGCIIVDESIFPFTKRDVEEYIPNKNRSGWYLQQLLKLYSGFIIDGILPNYLVIDADTLFLKPTTFFRDDKPLYNIAGEYHKPYFIHMEKLHPEFKKQTRHSGICHHMMFQTNIIKELFDKVCNYHNKKDFWKIFLENVDEKHYGASGASEYEIYLTFLMLYKKDQFIIRNLSWINYPIIPLNCHFDYISRHWYMRR